MAMTKGEVAALAAPEFNKLGSSKGTMKPIKRRLMI
jgi:hypothetical protein